MAQAPPERMGERVRFLITDTYYRQFWTGVYARDKSLGRRPYGEQLATLLGLTFGTSDFYSWNLRALGHEAEDVITNCEPLQRQWARENDPPLLRSREWLSHVMAAQVKAFGPDVLYVQDINWPGADAYREIVSTVPLIVGQAAYPLQPRFDYGTFDLIFTSLPYYVTLFRRAGLDSCYLPLAFEPRVRERLGSLPKPHYGAVFVGGVSSHHTEGTRLLERLAAAVPLDTWGYGYEKLPPTSPLRSRHHGAAYGLSMYRVLAQSRIVLNRHIDLAGRFAANMRLYEATGMGACLVTDRRDNLAQLFDPHREVVVYDSVDDCIDKVRYLLEHEAERAEIAAAGQRRTLGEHTYAHRMEEVAYQVEQRLRHPRPLGRRVFLIEPPPALSPARRLVSLGGRLVMRLPKPVQRLVTAVYERTAKVGRATDLVPAGREHVDRAAISPELRGGWTDPHIPERQWELVQKQLTAMYLGAAPAEFRAVADAIRATGLTDPRIIEVGCATAYLWEALGHLLRRAPRYVGVDYSAALIEAARVRYPEVPLLVGDAVSLPFADESCDVLLSGTVLLHVPEYHAAIKESARVTTGWCVFHRTPVVQSPTAYMAKTAYGSKVVDIAINELELRDWFTACGLRVVCELPVNRYSVPGAEEEVSVVTYVCAK
jgi:hypothetical protein